MMMRKIFFVWCLILSSFAAEAATSMPSLTNGAKQVLLISLNDGRVLLEKNADERMHPSSLTKVPGLFPLFERLLNGTLVMEDKFPVSTRAWRREGSRMFVEPNTNVAIQDLLRGVIVQSGNDAATVVAEGVSGTEEQYAHEMTQLAHDFGAKNTNFVNASGLPHKEHYTTARDLLTLSAQLFKRYAQFYPFFGEKEFTYNRIRQPNRNGLLFKSGLPVDGLKTGHSSKGGYGLISSAAQNGMRLLLVVNGTKSNKARTQISEAILRWGFRQFKLRTLFHAGEVIASPKTWLGTKGTVDLVVPSDIQETLSLAEMKKIKVKAIYNDPITAPILKGQQLGTLRMTLGDEVKEYPLISNENIGEVGMFGRALSALHYLIWGVSA